MITRRNKILGIVVLLLFFKMAITAQSYRTALGFRFGRSTMLSVSQRIAKKTTLDLYHESALYSDRMFTVLAAKKHLPLITKRLNVFIGVGPYHQYQSSVNGSDIPVTDQHTGGLIGTAGIDFTIGRLNIGYDIMPVMHLVGGGNNPIFYTRSGITLRYVIIKQPSKVRSWLKKKK